MTRAHTEFVTILQQATGQGREAAEGLGTALEALAAKHHILAERAVSPGLTEQQYAHWDAIEAQAREVVAGHPGITEVRFDADPRAESTIGLQLATGAHNSLTGTYRVPVDAKQRASLVADAFWEIAPQPWFALSAEGEMVPLGYCTGFDEADATPKGQEAVWVFDEATARDYQTQLASLLGPSAPQQGPTVDAVLAQALDTLRTLAEHPAFADDAPEFNAGGIGYEACRAIEALRSQSAVAAPDQSEEVGSYVERLEAVGGSRGDLADLVNLACDRLADHANAEGLDDQVRLLLENGWGEELDQRLTELEVNQSDRVDMRAELQNRNVYRADDGICGLAQGAFRYLVPTDGFEPGYGQHEGPCWLVDAEGDKSPDCDQPLVVREDRLIALARAEETALLAVADGEITLEEHERPFEGDDDHRFTPTP